MDSGTRETSDDGLRALLRHCPSRTAGRAELRDDWLRIHFGVSTAPAHADFDLRWLRDHCDRDRFAAWRTPRAPRPDRLAVEAAYVDAEHRLHVQWREEYTGRRVELLESVYDLRWLREQASEGGRA